MKREDRLNFIAQFIRENEIKTQEELVNTLLTHGIDVTQATVSRDIKSLALIKVPAESGGYRYDLPKNKEVLQSSLHKALAFDAITGTKIKDNMLWILANPGTTSLVKNYLLEEYSDDIFSIIIDDDSALVIFEMEEDAKNLQRKLFNTFEKVDDKSQEYSESMEVANEIGISQAQVSRLEKSAINHIKRSYN